MTHAHVSLHAVGRVEYFVEARREEHVGLQRTCFRTILRQSLLKLLHKLLHQVSNLLESVDRITDFRENLLNQFGRALTESPPKFVRQIVSIVVQKLIQLHFDLIEGLLGWRTIIKHALSILVIDDHDCEYWGQRTLDLQKTLQKRCGCFLTTSLIACENL